MKPVTIQINSLAALERLIGGDTQLEMDVRQSVAAAFAEKHLKAVAKDPKFSAIVAGLADALKKQASATIDDEIGTVKRRWDSQIESITFNHDVKVKLKERAASHVNEIIGEAIREAVEKWSNEETITNAIAKCVDARVAYRINEGVKAKLAEVTRGL